MKKQRNVAELNNAILKVASNVARAIEGEIEDTLEDGEDVVKKFVPARYVFKTLAAIEDILDDEGIEASFEKRITREALKRTAAEEVSQDEIDDLVKQVANAIVDEIEDILQDADDVMDDETNDFDSDSDDDDEVVEVEAKMKSVVEHKLASIGIHTRFARVTAKKHTSLVERVAKSYKG